MPDAHAWLGVRGDSGSGILGLPTQSRGGGKTFTTKKSEKSGGLIDAHGEPPMNR